VPSLTPDATAPPDDWQPVTGDGSDVVGITQRELLLEMRSDLKNLTTTVDSIAKDQALGAERRANMQRSADSIFLRLDAHDRELDDLRRWRDRADGAMVLARWALGASLISLIAVVLQVVAAVAKAMNPSLP
jgi:hypothetical protein